MLPERRWRSIRIAADVLARSVDLLAPLALGQRGCVSAARPARADDIAAFGRARVGPQGRGLVVLLVDERPEEAMRGARRFRRRRRRGDRRARPRDQVAVAELALERSRRRAESASDVVLSGDPLSRLARAGGDSSVVKHLFGSGRDLAEDGGLTVIGTVLEGVRTTGQARSAPWSTTESSLIALDLSSPPGVSTRPCGPARAGHPARRSSVIGTELEAVRSCARCSAIRRRPKPRPCCASDRGPPSNAEPCLAPSS